MDNYIGLGDSISISSYPSEDAGLGRKAKVGAVDLTGRALLAMSHVREMYNLACDGAITTDVYNQIKMLSPTIRNGCNIITLTAHGNDISFAGMARRRDPKAAGYDEAFEVIRNRYDELVGFTLQTFPNSILIINTSYDPSDGTGRLPDCGSWTEIVEWYSAMRRQFGEYLRSEYGENKVARVYLADLFKRFDGHGMREKNPALRWYYRDFMIEPGCLGAKEISSEWLEIACNFIAEAQQDQKRLSFSH